MEKLVLENEYKIVVPLFGSALEMKKVNKQCLLDTTRTIRVSEKT